MEGSPEEAPLPPEARAALFSVLETKEALADWIALYLGIVLPDGHVSVEGPNPSNCSPMEMVWWVYDACRRNATTEIPRVLAYASRDSFKSMGAAILEVLAVLHLGRNVGHMAAVKDQAQNVQKYVKEFFARPLLKDLKVAGDSKEVTEVVWYERPDGERLFRSEWKELPEAERARYSVVVRQIKIIVGTVDGCNSLHAGFVVVDEADLADEAAYKQARFIPSVFNGVEPITLIISTRKSAAGIVQREIDSAAKSGLTVWHWNLIDVTDRCLPERHLPGEPKVAIYRSDDLLAAISEGEWESLGEDEKAKYERDEGFAGCLKNCKLWVGCRGALARQSGFVPAESLKGPVGNARRSVFNTQERFVTNAADSEDLVKAEMWCWKASSEAVIYRRYDERKHRLTAAQIWERVTGEKAPAGLTRNRLLDEMVRRGARAHAGYDWGYSHNFVVVVGLEYGGCLYVAFAWSLGEMDDPQKVDFCKRHFGKLAPTGWPDMEAPDTIQLFKKSGFKMRDWDKGKGSVMAGVQAVRRGLWPGPNAKSPRLFFLAGDSGIDFLCSAVARWEWMRDKAGVVTDEPKEALKDENDALRYMVMNVLKIGGKGVRAVRDEAVEGAPARTDEALKKEAQKPVEDLRRYTTKNWAKSVMEDALGAEGTFGEGVPTAGKKGRFRWSF